MAVTPLPSLDRTAATFKTDVDSFFAQKLPKFSVEVNQVATDAQTSAAAAKTSQAGAASSQAAAGASAAAANTSKSNAATSEANAAASATKAASSQTGADASATAAKRSQEGAAASANAADASAARAEKSAASIGSGPVTSVNGKTGAASLAKGDIGLGLVDNVSVMAAGIGKAPLIGDVADINDVLLTNGWYSFGPKTAGDKPAGQDRGIVLVSGRAFQSDSRCTQLWFTEESTRIFARRSKASVWSEWLELTRPAPSVANRRKPLTFTTDPTGAFVEVWSDVLSVPTYLDKSITGNASAAQVLDVSSYSVFDFALTANTTFSISGLPGLSGETLTIIIRIRQNAAPKSIVWPSNITWLTYGKTVPPAPGAGQIVEYVLSTVGAPANWYGRVGAST